MKKVIVAIFLISIAGCANYAPSQSPALRQPRPQPTPCTQSVNITSDPLGALIEVDDDMKGKTPLTLSSPCYEDRTGKVMADALAGIPYKPHRGYYSIRALPNVAGQCLQGKTVFEDHLPANIYFQMNLCSARNDINVNVH